MLPLVIEGLVAGYGDLQVLRGVNLTAPRGGLTLVIGPNGSGKSTLLKTVFGMTRVFSGRITLGDREITRMKPHEIVRAGVGYVMQRRSVFPYLTVEENLRMGGWAIRDDSSKLQRNIDAVLELFPQLKELLNRKAVLLSGGQARLLEIARTLVADPALVMIDEPSAGLSPKMANAVYQHIMRLKEFGKTVLLVEQNVRSALPLADHVCVMREGTVVLASPREEVEGQLRDVIASWLRY
ncbi:MAG: ABC transporter ATP-binding protein [Nitrososphaerota archaeon]